MNLGEIEREQSRKHKRYRVYGDRELQNSLIFLDEAEEDNSCNDSSQNVQGTETTTASVPSKQSSSNARVPPISTNGFSMDIDFDSWPLESPPYPTPTPVPIAPIKGRRNERGKSKSESNWKDWREPYNKPRDIQYAFRHYADPEQHMAQYRQQYTYGQGLLQKEAGPQCDHVISRVHNQNSQIRSRYHQESSSPSSQWHSGVTPRGNNSESAILDLQHKYKFDRHALKAASNNNNGANNTNNIDKRTLVEVESVEDSDTPSVKSQPSTRVCSARSARSIRETIQARSSGTVNLTPTKSGSFKTPLLPQAKKPQPNAATPLDSPTASLPGKTPQFSMPNNSLRTLDLLSHVSTVDKQANLLDVEKEETPCLTTKCISVGRSNTPSTPATNGNADPSKLQKVDDPITKENSSNALNDADDILEYQVNFTRGLLAGQHRGAMGSRGRQGFERVEVVDFTEECSSLQSRHRGSPTSAAAHAASAGLAARSALTMTTDKAAVLQRYLTDLTGAEEAGDGNNNISVFGQNRMYSTNGEDQDDAAQNRLDLAGMTLSAFRAGRPRPTPSGARKRSGTRRLPHVFGRQDSSSGRNRQASLAAQQPKDFLFTQQGPVAKPTPEKAGYSVLRGFAEGPSIANGMWFDTSGRAYVSLATRYDPIRK